MKKFKKFLKIFFISLASLIVILIALGYIFRNKITDMVKDEINKNLTAVVDFKSVNISFFRHFPKVSLGLDELSVVGTGNFKGDTLLSAKRLDATVNIMSFIGGKDMQINGIFLNSPRVHALIDKGGNANWNIVKKKTPAQKEEKKSEPFHLSLTKYEITNGYVFYNDQEGGMSAEVNNLNHSGSGDFNDKIFTLHTKTKADEVTYIYGVLPVLYKVKADLDADFKIDNASDTYSFENLNLLLNALKISGNGTMKMLADGYNLNLQFKSAETDFKDLLSLVPVIYKNDFKNLTTQGTAIFEAGIIGKFSDSSMPGYHVLLNVKNGLLKYPDLPKSVNNINVNATIDNPDGITDNTIVHISSAHFQLGQDPFDFSLLMKRPMTDMFVDAAAKGKLDLSQVSEFIKLEKGTSLAGLLNSNISVKGNARDAEKGMYQDFFAAGNILLNGFKYVSKEYPSGILINNLKTNFTPSQINIENFAGEFMKTKFNGNGQINNLFSYIFSNKPLAADLTLNADKVNLNEWMGLSDSTASASTGNTVFEVPGNVNLNLNSKVNRVVYDNLDIQNLSGALLIKDQTVQLKNIHGNALDGQMTINGYYSTKDSKTKPVVSMSYDVNKVDIQKMFFAFNTVQKLMPIGKFLSGKLTSTLTAEGRLSEGMDVDMNSLTGSGNLFLIEGVLSQFAPLEKIASVLNVSKLRNISMKDVKTQFEFSEGKVLVKPFTLKVNGIEMEIGGLQGLDQSLDYAINMKLPRALMGSQGNQLVNKLASGLTSKGIHVSVSNTVSLNLGLEGTMMKPVVKVNLKQAGETLGDQINGQVNEFAQAKLESAKSAAADSLKSVKEKLTNTAKKEFANRILGSGKSDTTAPKSPANVKEEVKESAKGLLKGILGKKKKDSTQN